MTKTIYQKLKPHALAHVEAYRTDFTKHDRRMIREAKKGDTFIWLARESGTHMYLINCTATRDSAEHAEIMRGIGKSWEALAWHADARNIDTRAAFLVQFTSPHRGDIIELDHCPRDARDIVYAKEMAA